MEIALPYLDSYTFQSTTSSKIQYKFSDTYTSNRVIGTMHHASARNRSRTRGQSESDNSDSSKNCADEATELVQEPLPFDVLCGHDRNYFKHPGNQVYRDLIEGHVMLYKSSISKQEKMNITRSILSNMQHRYGSRFLRNCHDSHSGPEPDASGAKKKKRAAYHTVTTWQVLTHIQARDKISHALRSHKSTKQDEVCFGNPANCFVNDGNMHHDHLDHVNGNTQDTTYENTSIALSSSFGMGRIDRSDKRPKHSHEENNTCTVQPIERNYGIISQNPQNVSSNNIDTTAISNEKIAAFVPSYGTGHAQIMSRNDIDHNEWDSFDDHSIVFDDSNASVDLLEGDGGFGGLSASATTLNTTDDVFHGDDNHSIDVDEFAKPTGASSERSRKGS